MSVKSIWNLFGGTSDEKKNAFGQGEKSKRICRLSLSLMKPLQS